MREGGGVWDASPPLRVLCGRENIYADFTGGGGAFLNGGAELSIIQGCLLNPPLFSSSFVVFKDGAARVFHLMRTWAFSRPLCMYTVCTQEAIFQAPFLLFFFFFIRGDAPVADLSISSGRNGRRRRRRPSNIQPPCPTQKTARKGLHGSTTMAKEKEKPNFGFLPFLLRGLFLFYFPSFPLLASPMRVQHLVGLAWCFLTSALLLSSDSETSGGSPPSEEGWRYKVECVCIYQTTAPRRSN